MEFNHNFTYMSSILYNSQISYFDCNIHNHEIFQVKVTELNVLQIYAVFKTFYKMLCKNGKWAWMTKIMYFHTSKSQANVSSCTK
jgi:hypothetical protein